jgi:putative iron-dependent peroxidase
MLSNMFIGDPPGNTDRILDFSTAVTGGKFFTPIVDFLNDPPPLPDSQPEEEVTTVLPVPVATNGSLGIGSLKGTRQ